MAIQKDKTLANGVVGNYWRITKINVDRDNMVVNYVISLYLDKAHRLSGCDPLPCSKKYIISVTSEDLAGDLCAFGYTSIIAKAISQVAIPLSNPLVTTYYDADLANGTNV